MVVTYNSQLDAFELYHIIHEEDRSQSKSYSATTLPALGNAVSGATGSAISHLCLYPLDLIITRLQVQQRQRTKSAEASTGENDGENPSLSDTVRRIYAQEGGLQAFYSGAAHDTLKSVADSFLFFLAYTFLRERRRKGAALRSSNASPSPSRSLSVAEELAVGILAGAFAKFFTTPIQNVVTRKQIASMNAPSAPTKGTGISAPREASRGSVRAIVDQIRSEKGLAGFWSGYPASMVLTLNPSLTFLLQATFARWLLTRARRADPGAAVTFLLAAISKVVASSVTYPFSLAKARAQVASAEEKPEGPSAGDAAGRERGVRVRRALRLSVFGMLLQITRSEGVAALYQGLGAQVLKGFFEHGLTMLMKERILAVVPKLYHSLSQASHR